MSKVTHPYLHFATLRSATLKLPRGAAHTLDCAIKASVKNMKMYKNDDRYAILRTCPTMCSNSHRHATTPVSAIMRRRQFQDRHGWDRVLETAARIREPSKSATTGLLTLPLRRQSWIFLRFILVKPLTSCLPRNSDFMNGELV